MTQVSTQTELQAAIAAQEAEIEVTADFKIDTAQRITYSATISSGAGGPYTLTEADGHNGSLFFIENRGSLTLANIILDGAKETHSGSSNTGSLIGVPTGTLILDTGAVLQNNRMVQGGGVSCNGETSPINIIMRGDAVVRDNVAGNGDGTEVTEIPLGRTGGRTLYPRQEVGYTVFYSGNDEGGPPAENVPPPQRVPVGEGAPLSEELPTREGYEFTGWNTDPYGGGTAYQPGDTIYVTADLALYAQWKAVPPTIHLITYEPNGLSVEGLPEQQEVPEGETVSLSAAIPTRTGYRFLNWNSQPDGSGAVYQPGQTVGPLYADLTLYAQWAALPPLMHTLTYYGNDEGGPPAQWIPLPQQVPEGQIIALPDAIPTREGYLFTGWNTRPDGSGTSYQPGETFGPIFSDADLYAQWETIPPLMHTLTYYGNDTGGPPAQWIPLPQQVPEGQIIALPDAIPTRESYLFTGWNTRPDGSGTSYQPGETFGPIFSDADLYAQWETIPPLMHTLTYYGNDTGGPPAQDIPGPVIVLDGQSVTLSSTIPTREGFAFTGWNTDPSGMGITYQPGDTILDVRADMDLYAQWNPLPSPCYTLTYCGNDAGGPPACCIPCPERIPADQCTRISCCSPCRPCYCFTGWNTDPCGRGQTFCPGQTIGPVMGDVCLYAQWRRLPPPKPCYICQRESD
ncbi:InlB B-repeat-containing protein [Candidatus Soleaferrea massiliensis]|uniref:InlB B-repeat-containing protein n=1 Tax=Candidatus Soleaferrea massiliensis TaxID=1470354 RepID=UPI0005910E4B|nr:InlB B-repeat-containing protein [Candidatus Soleaferrea massiliensis]